MTDQFDGPDPADRVAIIGMAGRFPGAGGVAELWSLSEAGRTGVVRTGNPNGPTYHPAYGVLPDVDRFDAACFGMADHEAALVDPQQRVLLEVVLHALDDAGVDGANSVTSVYVSTAPHQGQNPETLASARYEWDLAHGTDYAATRIAYRLGLRGEAITVQTACSSSLVAVHLAAQSLVSGQSDLAVAGGVSIAADQSGYAVEEGMIASPTGACRPFDVAADGTVPGSGAGAVILKRLEDAERDGDRIRAVILGSAINNDGGTKLGFMAPSPTGQSEVIATAHAVARVRAGSIGYVETHGTATQFGDQIEIEGLRLAFELDPDRSGPTALGSLKANCGHLDRAAGVSGLIRATLALEHGVIPPMANCTAPASHLDLPGAGFRLPLEASAWPEMPGPRRAGVSAFGVGGTNVHVVLEQAPPAPESTRAANKNGHHLWLFSGHTRAAVESFGSAVGRSAAMRAVPPAAVAAALACRRPRSWRSWSVVPGESTDREPVLAAAAPRVVFLFPGQGEPVVDGMPDLYAREPVFAATIDRCAALIRSVAGWDVLDDLYGDLPTDERERRYEDMSRFQPALFTVQWALARLWDSHGVRPDAVLGHSIGEVTAAAVAGVLEEEQALRLVLQRGSLMESTAPGATLSIGLAAEAARDELDGRLELAADNGEHLCTVTGPDDEIAALQRRLAAREVACRRLNIRHSPHGSIMRTVAGQLKAAAAELTLTAPSIPMLANVTGTWGGAEVATASYWARQLCSQVRFREALDEVVALPDAVAVVVGPGPGFARMVEHELAGRVHGVVHPYAKLGSKHRDRPRDRRDWIGAAGQAWSLGVPLDLAVLCPATGQQVTLPPTTLDHSRRWPVAPAAALPPTDGLVRLADPGAWLTEPTWVELAGVAPVRRPVSRVGPHPEPWLEAVLAAAGEQGHDVVAAFEESAPVWGTTGALDAVWWPTESDNLLVRAAHLAERARGGDVRLWLLVTEEDGAAPGIVHGVARAAALVLPQEMPGLRVNLVLVPPSPGPDEAAALAALLGRPDEGSRFRVRRGGRTERHEHRVLWPAPIPRTLTPGGYVVTGGLGRVGQALTKALAEIVPGASVHLLGRRSGRDAQADLERLRDAVGAALRLGYHQVDVTDAVAVVGVLDAVRRESGGIAGVVHAAGMTERASFRTLADTSPADLASARTAKVEGTLALAAALRPDEAAFVLLCSSLSVELGGVRFGAYVSANAWQDAFARHRHATGDTRWMSVAWDAWLPRGGVRRRAGEARADGDLQSPYALDDRDGYEVLRRVLTLPGPEITVSTGDLSRRRHEVALQLDGASAAVAPASARERAEIEQVVGDVLAEVLGAPPADPDEDLRGRGIESLTILQIVSRLRARLGVHLSLAEAMRALSASGLARLASTEAPSAAVAMELRRFEPRAEYPTTAVQRRWLELFPNGYGAIDLVIEVIGAVTGDRLARAVDLTLDRHTALRTFFRRADGTWLQRVVDSTPTPHLDLRGLEPDEQTARLVELAQRGQESWFDPEVRPPFGVQVVSLSEQRHALVLHAHHVLFDGWSSSLFLRDLATFAVGDDPGPAPLQYTDYALAHDRYLRGTAIDAERRHWQSVFRGAPGPTRLPSPADLAGHAAGPGVDHAAVLTVELPTGTVASMRAMAEQRGTTIFTAMLTAYVLLVHRLSGVADVIVGTTAAGRPTHQAEEIVGVFVNPLPVRVQVRADESAGALLDRVHAVLVDFHEHGNYPLEDLVAHVEPFVGLGLNDTFSCYLLYQNYWRPDGLALQFRPLPVPGVQHKLMRDSEIVVVEQDGVLVTEVWWRTSRFTQAWARSAADSFRSLLDGLVGEGGLDRPVADLLDGAAPRPPNTAVE